MSDEMNNSAKTKKVFELLDELEDVVNTSSKLPLSDKSVIDAELTRELIEDIRVAIPRDLHEAAWLIGEKDRIINESREQYNKVLSSAKEQAEYLVENSAITKDAQKRANALITEAEKHSKYMKLKCYEHIDKILYDLQNNINVTEATYVEPMRDQLVSSYRNMQTQLSEDRSQMRTLAEQMKLQGAETDSVNE